MCANIIEFYHKLKVKSKQWIVHDLSRFFSGITISIIIHIVIAVVILNFSVTEKIEEPPISNITFLDMTKKAVKTPAKPQKSFFKKLKEKLPESIKPILREEKKAEQPDDLLAKKYVPDLTKKAPISLDHNSWIGRKIAPSKNKININNPEKKETEKFQVAAIKSQIDLDVTKKIALTSFNKPATEKSFPVQKIKNLKLDMTKNVLEQPQKNNPIKLDSKVKPMKLEKTSPPIKQTKTFITGPLANRQILKKQTPTFPAWAKRAGVGATVSLRFTVMENGIVKENVIVERTSGSREWDQLVITALKNWTFAPLEKAGIRCDQTGIITFQFVI